MNTNTLNNSETSTPVVEVQPTVQVSQVVNAAGNPAGPWRRLAAMIVDSLIISVIMLPFVWIAATQKSISLFTGDFSQNIDLLVEQSPWLMYVLIVIYLAYTIVLTVKKGGTPGKTYLYNFNVVNFKTQQRIGYGRALAREASKTAYNIPVIGTLLYIASICLVLLRNDRRSLHDFIVGTQVVKVAD